jgi:hypothetical protein
VTSRALDLEVLRKDRPCDAGQFQAQGDPEDLQWLQKRLRGWLEARRWDKSRWGEFEIVAREHGRAKVLGKVRGD